MDTITTIALPRGGITEIEVCAWLGQAAPGDALEYHRGFLALDASPHGPGGHDRRELRRVARRAFWAAETGLAHLVQRRHGTDDSSYLLIARPRPRTSPVSLSSLLLEEVA
jgi:hypothetical protein